MNDIVTTDLSEFGLQEIKEAGDLLKALAKGCDFLGDGITLNFNKNSGYVFLSDEDYNVAMVDDKGELYQFFTCPNCGAEGALEDLEHDDPKDPECKEWMKQIGVKI